MAIYSSTEKQREGVKCISHHDLISPSLSQSKIQICSSDSSPPQRTLMNSYCFQQFRTRRKGKKNKPPDKLAIFLNKPKWTMISNLVLVLLKHSLQYFKTCSSKLQTWLCQLLFGVCVHFVVGFFIGWWWFFNSPKVVVFLRKNIPRHYPYLPILPES